MNIDKIRQYLDKAAGVTHWVSNHYATEATTIIRMPKVYSVASGKLASAPNPHPREVISSPGETADVTVYSGFEVDGSSWLGDARNQLTSDDESALKPVVEGLVAAARSQRNKPFSLPGPDEKYPDVPLADPELINLDGLELRARAQDFSDRVVAACEGEPGVAVSNLEMFIQRHRVRFASSAGVSLAYPATKVDTEICFLARASDGRVGEHTARLSARRIADLDAGKIVAEYAAAARSIALAGPPPAWHGPVVLAGEAAADFLMLFNSPLSYHSAARFVYEKSNRYEKGKLVSDDAALKGEPLTVSSDPLVPYGLRSCRHSDVDGTACRAVRLMKDGRYDALFGQRRYFDYLGLIEQGVRPPGMPGNTVIPAGATSAAELASGDCVVVRAFSAYGVDDTSGQFSVEIRLGELRKAGKAAPFKSGLLVGNWFEAISDMRRSSETQQHQSYYGPLAVRFGNLQVAG